MISLIFVHIAIEPASCEVSEAKGKQDTEESHDDRTRVCGQVSGNNPAPLLESLKAISNTRQRRAYDRHIQV
jgi:hypothetical protein